MYRCIVGGWDEGWGCREEGGHVDGWGRATAAGKPVMVAREITANHQLSLLYNIFTLIRVSLAVTLNLHLRTTLFVNRLEDTYFSWSNDVFDREFPTLLKVTFLTIGSFSISLFKSKFRPLPIYIVSRAPFSIISPRPLSPSTLYDHKSTWIFICRTLNLLPVRPMWTNNNLLSHRSHRLDPATLLQPLLFLVHHRL